MSVQERIFKIATEVNEKIPKLPPARLSDTDYFVAAHHALSEATYSGRDQEFSITKFRSAMLLASAWCQLAASVEVSTILPERLRQERLWGDKFDRENTYNDWHAYIAHYMSHALRSSAQGYQLNMVKAACIAQGAVLMIDCYGRCAPRHYEHKPRSGAKKIDLCDSCVQQSDCTIAAGRTESCNRFQPIGRD